MTRGASPAAFLREHAVDHLTGQSEIVCRIADFAELRAVEMTGDFSIPRQQINQRLAGRRNLAADVVDEIMGALAAEVRSELHHHGFRHDHPARQIEIGPHALGVDLEA